MINLVLVVPYYVNMDSKKFEVEYILKRPKVFIGATSEGVVESSDKIPAVNNQTHVNLGEQEIADSKSNIGLELNRGQPLSSSGSGLKDDQEKVHSQPYRTTPLVMPAPRTINEVGAGATTYQQVRGPQYQAVNRPTLLQDKTSMRNSSINQSASFKKVMYSVLGETEF